MNISRKLFHLYIYLLPISLLPIFRVIRDYFSPSASIQNSFFIMILGLLVLLLKKRSSFVIRNSFMIKTLLFIIFLSISTFFMSLLLYPKLGVLYGENTFTATLSSYFYLFLIIIVFYYNSKGSNFLSVHDLDKIFKRIALFMIFIGYVQILIILRVKYIAEVYDLVDIMDVFRDSQYILNINRIPLSGREPASVAIILGCFILPFLLSKIATEKRKFFYIFQVVLFLPIVYFTLSSSVYIAVALNFIIYFILFDSRVQRFRKIVLSKLIIRSLILISFVIISTFGFFGVNMSLFQTITDFLFEKTTNLNDMSTGYRYTTVINSIHILVDYPILGVGSGNQGFFYNANLNKSSLVNSGMLSSISTKSALAGEFGLIGGGAFLPDFVSSYGLVGIIILFMYGKSTRKYLKSNKSLGHYSKLYAISTLTFLVLAIATTSIYGNFMIMFVLTIPNMNFREHKHDSIR
jgi:hypothetical protein